MLSPDLFKMTPVFINNPQNVDMFYYCFHYLCHTLNFITSKNRAKIKHPSICIYYSIIHFFPKFSLDSIVGHTHMYLYTKNNNHTLDVVNFQIGFIADGVKKTTTPVTKQKNNKPIRLLYFSLQES